MRALITGSSGFLGRHFTAELRARGYTVDGWDIRERCDALDLFAAETPIGPYDLVVHAAARAPHRLAIDTDPASHVYNQLLDAAMFDWAIRTRPARVVYLSSCAVLDEQPDAYGLVKLSGERMAEQARACGVPVTVVRPYSGYGEDQSADFPFGAFLARARAREDPFEIWGDGTQVRDWVHAEDLIGASLAAVERGIDGPVSICTGRATSCNDLVDMLTSTAGYSPRLEHLADAPRGVPRRVGNPTEMLAVYKPRVTLEEGVRRALLR
jgi:nucleoside-diphosphate-sugar epimerase